MSERAAGAREGKGARDANAPSAVPKSARRRSREFALQGLYGWLLSRNASDLVHVKADSAYGAGDAPVPVSAADTAAADKAEAVLLDAHLRESPGFEKADAGHFDALLHGVIANAASLREVIGKHLDRPVAELSPVEHAVLLLAAYEMREHREIPYRVVINEAVEITKAFGGTDGFKYVNGVLDKVAADLRPDEFAARKR